MNVVENFITKVKINKIRHLRDIEIKLPEDKRTHLILTGRNGSGKTSVLESIRLWILSEVEDYYPEFFSILGNNPLKNQFYLDENINPKDYELSFFLEADSYKKELQAKAGLDLSFKDNNIKDQTERGKYIIAYYAAERSYIGSEETFVEKISLKDSYKIYEKPGKNFVKYLMNLRTREALYRDTNDMERADMIKRWLERLTGILRKIFDDSQLELYPDIEELKFKIKSTGKNSFAFDELSSGYSAIIDIVTDLMMRMEKNYGKNYDVEGVVLIDEIDAHLHIELQRKI